MGRGTRAGRACVERCDCETGLRLGVSDCLCFLCERARPPLLLLLLLPLLLLNVGGSMLAVLAQPPPLVAIASRQRVHRLPAAVR